MRYDSGQYCKTGSLVGAIFALRMIQREIVLLPLAVYILFFMDMLAGISLDILRLKPKYMEDRVIQKWTQRY